MAPNFSKNAILKGYVDYFCLICETYLRNEDETTSHISKESHQSNLNKTNYIDDFKEEFIKKINSNYFCELCNKLLPLLAKVHIHISEPLHLDMKKGNILSYRNNNVVAFNKVVINEESWHGLNENSCAVCNLEYDNRDEHKADVSHIIKLIQIRVDFHEDKHLYRKIDETTFQCLTCHTVAALDDLITHFEEIEHKNKYQKCCEAFHKLLQVGSDNSFLDNNSYLQDSSNESKENYKEKEVIKSSSKITTETFDMIPKEKGINEPELTENRNEHFKYIFDENCENEICKALNATDYITVDDNGLSWCILCNWVMSPQNVSYHRKGKHHLTILKFHRERIEKYKNMNKVTQIPVNNSTETIENDSDLLKFVDEFQKNGIKIDFESTTAICKKCSSANILEFNYNDINNHINGHRNVSKKQTKTLPFPSGDTKVGDKKNMLFTSPVVKQNKVNKVGTESEVLFNVAKHIKHDDQENKSEIKHDQTNDDNKKNTAFKELSNDVTEEPSKDIKIVKRYKRIVLKRIIFKVFLETITAVNSALYQDLIINNKYVINMFSFSSFVSKNNITECVACNENISFDLFRHVESISHTIKIEEMIVITDIDSEFIREVTHNKFHCGFCNSVEISWEDMLVHVKTYIHKEAKNAAEWRLSQYKTEMANREFRAEIAPEFDPSMFAKHFFNN